ncbi:MAG: methyltransferase domain-containing protein [Anaerolineae bacterium]|nr:methyltransferase domain-containing protein [Anaerolineae bacterium]
MKQNEYRAFYEALGGQAYMEFEFTANTTAEVNFVLDVLNVAPGQRILDMGCGPGRHAIELARRGFQVTGVDFTQSFIDAGRKLAAQANTQVDFVCRDARDFVRTRS